MRVMICSGLFAFVLGCNVSAEIHQVLREKQQGRLRCSHSVEGEVTWSRETNGNKTDLLTSDGDGHTKHIKDPYKRYSSEADHTLVILKVKISDTGRYFCNNEAAVELTVIPSEVSKVSAALRDSVSLMCPSPGSHVPVWTRQNSTANTTVFCPNGTARGHSRFQYSAEAKTLNISRVRAEDAGLYYCGGKAAAYLTVDKGQQLEMAPDVAVVLGVLLPLLLIIFIVVFLIWNSRIRRRGRGEQRMETEYAVITDGLMLEPAQNGSNQHGLTYSDIHHPPAQGNRSVASEPNKSIYSVIHL